MWRPQTVLITVDNVYGRVEDIRAYCCRNDGSEIIVTGPIGSGVINALSKVFPDNVRVLGALMDPTDVLIVKHIVLDAQKNGKVIIVDGLCSVDSINVLFNHFIKSGGTLIRIHNSKIDKM